jgi:outer membrane cobalamin receptor
MQNRTKGTRFMKILPLPLMLCALPGVAAAQAPDVTADEAASIVVTGTGLSLPPGTPAYGSVVIDRDRLEDAASGRIESVLADVAGFQQFRRSDSRASNPSNQGATLRALGGNASSRTLVLLDGVPVADPFFGYIPFSALVPDRLALVRVTRGGGSGAFGAGAVAGTIELASATRDQMPHFGASAFYGSRDATELSASIAPDLGSGYVSLSGRWDRGDGFQTTPRDQRVAATVPAAYDSWSTNLRAVAPIDATSEIQFRGTLFQDNRTPISRRATSPISSSPPPASASRSTSATRPRPGSAARSSCARRWARSMYCASAWIAALPPATCMRMPIMPASPATR